MSEDSNFLNITKDELESILRKNVSKELNVETFSSNPVNQKGENYGSSLYTLSVTVHFPSRNSSQILHMIAKTAPPSEYLRDMFDFPVSFCKEMNFYKLVHAGYTHLIKEGDVSMKDIVGIFPAFYGARTSLTSDEDEKADLSAILLIENLKTLNYQTEDRLKGLDLKHSELTIIKLAEFHALPIALKQKNPLIYADAVLKAACFKPNPNLDESAQDHFCDMFLQTLLSQNPNLHPYFDKIKKRITENKTNWPPVGKEPFATVVHMDLWTSNIMFSYSMENDETIPTSVKFIDFQGSVICSPVKDIIFFLLTSTQDYVIEKYFDYLIELYYESFVKKLKQLHCEIEEYPKDKFYDEISEFAPSNLYHSAIMLTVIYKERSEVKELKDVTFEEVMRSWSQLSKNKLERIVKFLDKRGWL